MKTKSQRNKFYDMTPLRLTAERGRGKPPRPYAEYISQPKPRSCISSLDRNQCKRIKRRQKKQPWHRWLNTLRKRGRRWNPCAEVKITSLYGKPPHDMPNTMPYGIHLQSKDTVGGQIQCDSSYNIYTVAFRAGRCLCPLVESENN